MDRRYVLLAHDHPWLHWDFMIEAGSRLRSWRFQEIPRAGRVIVAERIADHRRDYLDYEGPVSGARGSVQRVAYGTFTWLEETETRQHLQLCGVLLHGTLCLDWQAESRWHAVYQSNTP